MALPQQNTMTSAQYLAFERGSDIRHEYIDGYVYAITGANENHNLIVVNLTAAFHRQFRKRPCKVYAEGMRVQAGKNYLYPDIVALCGHAEFADETFDMLTNLQVIVEVQSPTTKRYDEGGKFELYRRLDTLQEYLLVSQETPHVSHYVRQENGAWLPHDIVGLDATVNIEAVDMALPLEDIYEKVEFPKPAPPTTQTVRQSHLYTAPHL
ncbi:MAG: Uma2 family endonuclease, partial [Chloroflexota bacterium]